MNEICMVNNELHDHFTRQSHFIPARKGSNQINLLNAAITLVLEFGIPFKRSLMFLFPFLVPISSPFKYMHLMSFIDLLLIE